MINMKFIVERDDGTTDFDPYFDYLASIQHLLPDSLSEFARDKARYDMTNRGSLHDSWVRQYRLDVVPSKGSEIVTTTVGIVLLGPFHDRTHKLRYGNVSAVLLSGIFENSDADLLTHEFRAEEDHFVHEMLFDKGGNLRIEFTEFCHTEDFFGAL